MHGAGHYLLPKIAMAKEPTKKRPTGDKKPRFPRPFGRYILEKSLSRGGMGEVYLAIVKQLQRRCVIKTIRGDLTGEEEFIGRFADEAKILVRAAHANIIRYFDAGKVADDYYIAMEHVHGRDLGDVLDRAYERGEPMPPDIGLYITHNLLEGLDYAHQMTDESGRPMGLVHRDISPQNVMIGFDGSIKLIDFGLARTDVLPSRTQGALAVGKYGYMSPEQARHEPLDGRADIYSAGVMLFEVFTGDRLVDERDQATLWQRVLHPKHRNPRAVLPSLSTDIDRLVMRAVAVKPRERFSSARAMADFVSTLRGPKSNKKSLLDYLHYLYPNVDFSPPSIPPLDNLADGVRQSTIFATSREGARSVFGRGELPIDGTMLFNAEDVRREINKRQQLGSAADSPKANYNTRLITKPERAPIFDPTRGHFKQVPISKQVMASHGAQTEVMAPQSEHALLGEAGISKSPQEDEKQTVMMYGPPSTLTTKSKRSALVFDDEHSLDDNHQAGADTLDLESPQRTRVTEAVKDPTSADDLLPFSSLGASQEISAPTRPVPPPPRLSSPGIKEYVPVLAPLERNSPEELSLTVITGLVALVVSILVVVIGLLVY